MLGLPPSTSRALRIPGNLTKAWPTLITLQLYTYMHLMEVWSIKVKLRGELFHSGTTYEQLDWKDTEKILRKY